MNTELNAGALYDDLLNVINDDYRVCYNHRATPGAKKAAINQMIKFDKIFILPKKQALKVKEAKRHLSI